MDAFHTASIGNAFHFAKPSCSQDFGAIPIIASRCAVAVKLWGKLDCMTGSVEALAEEAFHSIDVQTGLKGQRFSRFQDVLVIPDTYSILHYRQ